MKKVLFTDRAGTLIKEPEDFEVDSFEKLTFYPRAISNLSKIAKELHFELVMITNQDGLGTDSFHENTFWPPEFPCLIVQGHICFAIPFHISSWFRECPINLSGTSSAIRASLPPACT